MNKRILLTTFISGIMALGARTQTFSPIGAGNYSLTSSSIVIDGNDIYADNMFINGSDIFTYGRLSNGTWNKLGNWGSVIGINCAVKIGDDIYVGGHFTGAAGNPDMNRIARWNTITNTWHALGSGLNDFVMDIIPMGTDIVVAGKFTNAGGDANADYIAKWNGTSWQALGTQVISSNSFTVVSALELHNNELYVGGNFYASNGGATDYLAKWNGTSFETVGGWSQTGAVYDIVFDATGKMYIGGEFPAKIARYNGTAWEMLGTFTSTGASWISDIELIGTDVYVGGKFQDAAGVADADNIAKWNGTAWQAVAGGLNEEVYQMVPSGNDLYIAGKFTDAGGVAEADKLVKLGLGGSTGVDNPSSAVSATFNVFPNPSHGEFTIQSADGGVFQIIDLSGRILSTHRVTINNHTVRENLTAGIYFIREVNTRSVSKFVVK